MRDLTVSRMRKPVLSHLLRIRIIRGNEEVFFRQFAYRQANFTGDGSYFCCMTTFIHLPLSLGGCLIIHERETERGKKNKPKTHTGSDLSARCLPYGLPDEQPDAPYPDAPVLHPYTHKFQSQIHASYTGARRLH